jgi:hypothetical protein
MSSNVLVGWKLENDAPQGTLATVYLRAIFGVSFVVSISYESVSTALRI